MGQLIVMHDVGSLGTDGGCFKGGGGWVAAMVVLPSWMRGRPRMCL